MALTHIEAPHGDNPSWLVTLYDEAGAVYDPDNATEIWWTVKTVLSDADAAAVFQKTKTAGGITAVTHDGVKKARLSWTAADAAGLEANRSYYFSVRVLESTGRVGTPLSGTLTSTPSHATLSYST